MTQRLLVFTLDGQRYGLPMERVERVLRAVEVTPLPGAPEVVMGMIDVQGRVIAAADPRRRLGLPERELQLGDQLVIARCARRTVALRVDAVTGLIDYDQRELVPPRDIVPGIGHVAGVVRTEDGLVLIQDLERFLSLDEERSLDEALAHAHG